MEAHNEIVAGVAERVKHFHALQKPFRIYHGSTNSTRASPKSASNTVDTSRLANVLAVDPARRTATAEPNVPLGDLVAATLAHGLVPLVVMEFPGITVGGGFSGSSGESSSFRHGAFDATVESIEIVLADGTVERASRADKPDLLWGAASSFGTLGVVTLLEVRLRPASKYVRLEYHLLRTPEDSVRKIRAECARDENDYVDGIVFAMDQTVVCTGRMVDDKPDGEDERRFTRPSDPWFYLRAQDVKNQLLKSGGDTTSPTTTSTTTTATTTATTTVTKVDYIPLVDYLFRYDRGGFWMARYAFTYFATPFNRLTRRALDRFMHTKTMYHAMHKSGLADSYVIQDVGVTWETAADFQRWLHNDSGLGGGKKGSGKKGGGIYPLWLCPLRIRRDDPDSGHGLHAEFSNPGTVPELLNFGVWGPVGTPDRREAVRLNRALEHKVQSCGGKKWLYAQAFYTEDEFWAHYQKDSYFALREKYRAGYLPSVYDKVKVDVDEEERAARARPAHRRLAKKVWPLRGLYGVYHAWRGHDYLLQKRVEETSAKA